MKKIIPLIFSVLYVLNSNAQAVGGWGTCEFADVATMNAFDPSTNAYDCKKVFVQATNNHYYWNGTIWVLVSDTDDQNASEVPFTPVGTIAATDVQAAIAEIEPDIYGSIDVHSDVDITTTAPSSGDLLSWDGSNFVPSSTDNGYTVFNIFAEESSALNASGETEWAFGNGDNTPSGHGIVIPVDCELFAMSLDHEGGANTTVRIIKNTDATLATYQVVTSGSENGYNTFGTPLSFSAGDIANFRTISASSTGSSGRVSAWFRIRATPASTSLVNDMLDVSAGSIANGDILYFDGSSFVPLTLEAGNIPYDNTTSGLTATDAQAAIDELAAGSSSINIYTDNGTLEEDRIVTMDGNNLTFDGTGTGDVIIEAGGDVGIGTLTPAARLDVDGGQVRFSDYGTPTTYDDASPTKLLGVQPDGDVVQIATSSIIGTDDQNASEVPFKPAASIVATDVQAAFEEIEPDIYGSIDVHSDIDLTTTAPSNGDVLSWDGSNFVPISGGSSDNIYTTDGSIDANREVSLGNFDIEFNSSGTGDFFVSDNGTIVFAVEDDHVGIGTANPTKPLHIFETTGTPASATNGTIFLEKGDAGGSQSIVFESAVNAGSDYAYIEYSDDGSGNGSTTENSLLVIGTQNDVPGIYQDDIAIMPSGYLGVGTTSPDAFFDVSGGQVRFSNYGIGTYDDASPVRLLGVQADGDIIEVDPATLGGSSSSAVGTIYIESGNQVETNLSEDTPAKANGTTTLINENDVDMPLNNRLRYIGSGTQTFLVTCNLSSQTDNNNRQVYYTIRKGSDTDPPTIIPSILAAEHHSSTDESDELNSTTLTGTVELSNGEYIELWIENVESGSDVTIWYMNLSMIAASGSGGSGGSSDNIYTASGTLGGSRTVTMDGNDLTFDGTSDMIITQDGEVGIGTTTPDALLDVENGNVRFSDYGGGAITGTVTQILGVDVDGDVIEVDPSSLGGGGSGSNIYTSNGTLSGNRIVTMNGNDLLFDSGSNSNFTIDGFSGSSSANPIFQIDRNNGRELKIFHEDDSNSGYWNIATNDGIALEVDDSDGDGIYLEFTGDVGIGTSTPDRKLDVEGGQVRFSDYGTGTYEDTTAVYLLGVEADGDLIEMNTAKNSRIFYPPAIAIVADAVVSNQTLDLHQTYVDLFEGADPSFVKSTSAPGAIPTYAQDELYYYILDYDTSVFDNVQINDNGEMTYNVIAVASDNCSFINVVFVVKEP